MAQSKKSASSTRNNTSSRSTSRSGSSSGKRTSAKSSSGASSRTSPKSSSKATASKRSASSAPKDDIVEVGIGDYWHAFTKTRVFVPIMVILVTAVLVGLDLLISWNTYERFFMLLGIELIIAAAGWLIIMIYSIGSSKKSSSGSKDEV